MIKTKVAFSEGRLSSSQSELFEKFSKNFDWLEKSWPSKKATFVLIMHTGYLFIFSAGYLSAIINICNIKGSS